jgi:hypothetical protein
MDEHGDKVFSIWYGVFDCQTGTIQFGTAGHPPALLVCRWTTRIAVAGGKRSSDWSY